MRLEELANKINEASNDADREFQIELAKEFDKLFELNPNIHAFSWVQYTPYFMDGDPCLFCVHDIYGVTSDIENYDNNPEEKEGTVYLSELNKPLAFMLNVFENQFKNAFGDGYRVTYTRSKEFKIENYIHD